MRSPNVPAGPPAPATFAFASVPRSRKAARKKTSRTKSPKTFSARIRRPTNERGRAKTALQYLPLPDQTIQPLVITDGQGSSHSVSRPIRLILVQADAASPATGTRSRDGSAESRTFISVVHSGQGISISPIALGDSRYPTPQLCRDGETISKDAEGPCRCSPAPLGVRLFFLSCAS
jgi:hypothetical protein